MGLSYSTPEPPPPPAKPKQIIRVCGVGDPVTDILVRVDPALLQFTGLKPGSCTLVNKPSDIEALLKVCQDRGSGRLDMVSVAAGSAANVIKGVAALGRGVVTVELVGTLGRDKTGQEYKQLMNLAGVGTSAVAFSDKGSPSAQAVCLITPDGQRTMRVSLGAAGDLDERSLKQPEVAALLTTSQLLHVEGYALRRPAAVRAAVTATSSSGGVVSLDLASTDVVHQCFQTLSDILRLNVVDLVFGNESELEALGVAEAKAAGRAVVPDGAAAREAGVDFLLQFVQVVNVTMGGDGSMTIRRDKERFVTPALDVRVVDTTGAGDIYTAGFLWALLHGAPLPICAAQGSAMAAEVIQVVGTTLDDATWRRLREGSYGYQPAQQPQSSNLAATSPSIGTLLGLDRNDYAPQKPHIIGVGSTARLPEGPGSRSINGGVWGVGDEQYDPDNQNSANAHLKPSEYGYNSQGDIVKIRRTMSGRIYGAVFERLEKIPPPVGGALHRRASSKVLDTASMAGGMERSESSSTVAALEAAGPAAGGCGMPSDYGGYSTYLGYLLAWGLGWTEEAEAPNAETASVRMRRSMSSRVMQQGVIDSVR